jgi:hypothetical protein
MRRPGVLRGKVVSELTANVDLADATGLQPCRTLDGISLLDLAVHPSLYAGRARRPHAEGGGWCEVGRL